jgi:hypothetical protein
VSFEIFDVKARLLDNNPIGKESMEPLFQPPPSVIYALENHISALYSGEARFEADEFFSLKKEKVGTRHSDHSRIITAVGAASIRRGYLEWENDRKTAASRQSYNEDIETFVKALSDKDENESSFMSWISTALWFTVNVVACPRQVGYELWSSFFNLMQREAREKHQKELLELEKSTETFFEMISGTLLEQPDKRFSFEKYCEHAVSHAKEVQEILYGLERQEPFLVNCLKKENMEVSLAKSFGDPARVLNYLEVNVSVNVTERWMKKDLVDVFEAYSKAFGSNEQNKVTSELVAKSAFDIRSGELKEMLEIDHKHIEGQSEDTDELIFFARFRHKNPLVFQIRMTFTCQPQTGKHRRELELFIKDILPPELSQPEVVYSNSPSILSPRHDEKDDKERDFQTYLNRAHDLQECFKTLLSKNDARAIIDTRKREYKSDSKESPDEIFDYLQGTIHIVESFSQDQPGALVQAFKKLLTTFGPNILHIQPCPVGNGNFIPRVILYIAHSNRSRPNEWLICEVQVLLELAGIDTDFLHFLSAVSKLEQQLLKSSSINVKMRVEELLTNLLNNCGMEVDPRIWLDISQMETFDLKLIKVDEDLIKLKISGKSKDLNQIKPPSHQYFKISREEDTKAERKYFTLKTMRKLIKTQY